MSGLPASVEPSGRQVRLEPLTPAHAPELAADVEDGQLYRLWYAGVPETQSMAAYMDEAVAMPHGGTVLASGELAGSTRYCHADRIASRLEIGYTRYAARAQRTAGSEMSAGVSPGAGRHR